MTRILRMSRVRVFRRLSFLAKLETTCTSLVDCAHVNCEVIRREWEENFNDRLNDLLRYPRTN